MESLELVVSPNLVFLDSFKYKCRALKEYRICNFYWYHSFHSCHSIAFNGMQLSFRAINIIYRIIQIRRQPSCRERLFGIFGHWVVSEAVNYAQMATHSYSVHFTMMKFIFESQHPNDRNTPKFNWYIKVAFLHSWRVVFILSKPLCLLISTTLQMRYWRFVEQCVSK